MNVWEYFGNFVILQKPAATDHNPPISSSRQIPPASQQIKVVDPNRYKGNTSMQKNFQSNTEFFQVLALMNAANNSCSPTIIDYTEFYNITLDHMDLMKVI